MITKPQNVLILRDVMLSGYVAGCNTAWFGQPENSPGVTEPISGTRVQQGITDRLSFVDDVGAQYGSMLAFAVPFNEGSKRDQVVSLSHRLLPWEVTQPADDYKKYFPGGPHAFALYGERYGLAQIHFGEDVRAAENMEFISQGSVNNALCFIGPHRKFSPFTQNFYELNPGQGHFGPDAIPGVSFALTIDLRQPEQWLHSANTLQFCLWQDARWRRGESVSLSAARNSMVSLEVAAHSQLVMAKRATTA